MTGFRTILRGPLGPAFGAIALLFCSAALPGNLWLIIPATAAAELHDPFVVVIAFIGAGVSRAWWQTLLFAAAAGAVPATVIYNGPIFYSPEMMWTGFFGAALLVVLIIGPIASLISFLNSPRPDWDAHP